MIKGKVTIAGTMNVDGDELTGLFVELDKDTLKNCPFNLLRAEITIEENKDTKKIREDAPAIPQRLPRFDEVFCEFCKVYEADAPAFYKEGFLKFYNFFINKQGGRGEKRLSQL